MKLDDTILKYRIYNAEMLEKLINTVHEIHNTTSLHEKLFAGEHNHSIFRILYTPSGCPTLFHHLTPILENYSGQIHCNVQGIDNPIASLCINHWNTSKGIFA